MFWSTSRWGTQAAFESGSTAMRWAWVPVRALESLLDGRTRTTMPICSNPRLKGLTLLMKFKLHGRAAPPEQALCMSTAKRKHQRQLYLSRSHRITLGVQTAAMPPRPPAVPMRTARAIRFCRAPPARAAPDSTEPGMIAPISTSATSTRKQSLTSATTSRSASTPKEASCACAPPASSARASTNASATRGLCARSSMSRPFAGRSRRKSWRRLSTSTR
mmetsp:Transcript_28361/g.67247  ORF Transcript_28361/g.67247 Transcript_28361/m.67247 type:complete len:219 (-) Transcript_28361:1163-1819(-)